MGIWRSTTVVPDDERSDNEPLLRLEMMVRAAQSLCEKALYDYSVARQRDPGSPDLLSILSDALLDIDRRLEQGLKAAGLAPTRDGGKT